MMPLTKHKINDQGLGTGGVTRHWLSNEMTMAESSLCRVTEACEENDRASNDSGIDGLERGKVPVEKKELNIPSICKEVDVISLARAYYDVIQNSRTRNEQEFLVYIESRLKHILQSHYSFLFASSQEFKSIYGEISRRHTFIQLRIQSEAIISVRKTLRQNSYPSPQASKLILSEMEKQPSCSDFRMHIESLREIDRKILTKEFVSPIFQRVKHHFLVSRTIPQEKLMKIPHLILAYLRNIISYTALVVSKIEIEVDFYHQINQLIQHVCFQRGYFEKFHTANVAILTVFVQDVLTFDSFVRDNVQGQSIVELSSLTEHIICRNMRLFQWWIKSQRDYALHILGNSKNDGAISGCKSVAETFQALLYSLRAKISLLRQSPYRSMCFEQVVIPVCMEYLDLQHHRATAVRNSMDSSTIYNLPSIILTWLDLIEEIEQSGAKLDAFDSPELSSLGGSFEKFSDAMIDDCANSYVNLLETRSTLSSFIMTTGHLLSHGETSVHNNDMDCVYMILKVWKSETILSRRDRKARDTIVKKVSHYLERQFLEVVMDESLEMQTAGCRSFSNIVLEMIRALNIQEEESLCGRLRDIALFMTKAHQIHAVIHKLMDKAQSEQLDYFELEQDSILFNEVGSMVRSKGFTSMTIEDAISLLNRCGSVRSDSS